MRSINSYLVSRVLLISLHHKLKALRPTPPLSIPILEVILIAERYRSFAPLYDLFSAEWPVYRAGRKLGIDSLGLQPGNQVLDIGCGTGLNFGLLHRRIGPEGRIVGIDRSPDMLAQARRKATRNRWTNIILIEADATTLTPADICASIAVQGGREHSEAALATYALSLMADWETAWTNMILLSSPGASMSVVDMQAPTGVYSLATPLARVACRLGGADITAHPWTGVERDCDDIQAASARGGHLQIRTGRRR
ncbi:class I SAM-dependent methyltransferase [Arthrobacter sp. CAN_A214]|uniref:class I SAM-dependent methyltransferase n=1 Tax=Arthrobacter sp. CAN_A214 TaxID=2787720 RepID=UPI0018CABFA9